MFISGKKYPERASGSAYGRDRPVEEPDENEVLLRLAGVSSYGPREITF
jgi:hypothetical protein